MERTGATLELVGAALGFAVFAGIAAGLVCAVYRDRLPDIMLSSVAVAGQSMPSFWLGILLIQIFALSLHWLPTSGTGGISHVILPAVTLGTFLLPNFVLITRASVIEVAGDQFVVTARAKGLSRLRILLTHIVPNAVNPILSFLGIQIGTLMAGSIITESVFAWPGIGRLMVTSIFNRDVPVVVCAVFFISISIIFANLIVDVLQTLIDPRIRRH
jgi:ABC-type dipeptide/oligopeptide/nickel transport system permease component